MKKILANISERVQAFIKEEMGFARTQPEDSLDAQARIVAQVFRLWGRDQIKLA
ncbi:MAG: flagellar motor switch protein FliG [Candidatus Latescibacterota bacterium]|jgi:flagellar motor switch protein FliG